MDDREQLLMRSLDRAIEESKDQPKFLDVNGQPTLYSITEINEMIRILEDTGKYDVVGRRW